MEELNEQDFNPNKSEKKELHQRKADAISRLKKNKSEEIFDYLKQYRQEKREKEKLLRKDAVKLQNESRELSLKEKEVLRLAKEVETAHLKKTETARLNRKKRIAALTPEQKEALNLKRRLQRQKQKETLATEKEDDLKEKQLVERSEYLKQYRRKNRQKNRVKYESLQREAIKLQSENRDLSSNEKEILRKAQEIETARLKGNKISKEYRRKIINSVTPEDIRKKKEAQKLLLSNNLKGKSIQEVTALLNKNQNSEMSLEQSEIQKLALKMKAARLRKIENHKKRYSSLTPEEKEVFRLKRYLLDKKRRELDALKPPEERKRDTKYQKQCRERKRERDELLRKEAAKVLKLNRELSLKEKDILRLANEMEDKRRRRNIATSRKFRKPAPTIGKIKEKKVYGQELFQTKEYLIGNEQITSNFAFATNEIKIENEEMQETTIIPIPVILQKDLYDSSCSLPESSAESFNTEENHRYFRSFSERENFLNRKSDRRKNDVEDSLGCMRELIENVAKGDEFAVFGKLIAQKIRSSDTDASEVNIAKLLIDNVLQNLQF